MTSGVYVRSEAHKGRLSDHMKKIQKLSSGPQTQIDKTCGNCLKNFTTRWVRGVYCSRSCYMVGVSERSKQWLKTDQGKNFVAKYRTDAARRIRIAALERLGSVCKRCGFSDLRALQIDHVFGDGKQERGTRKSMYNRIAKGTADMSKYQLLCANCNWIKRFENNEGKLKGDYNQYLIEASIRGYGKSRGS